MSEEMKPSPRPCSMCGQQLEPHLMGTGINSDYTTHYYWGFGHICPKQTERYDQRIREISESSMSEEQKANATRAAGFMNAWGG